jgi:GTPase SAR1 family protein
VCTLALASDCLRLTSIVAMPGVNFMEKTISIRNTEITFSVRPLARQLPCLRPSWRSHYPWRSIQIWDLGGQREFVSMLPICCNDAVAILFAFDLTRKSTLNSVKEWWRQARGFNNVGRPSPLQLDGHGRCWWPLALLSLSATQTAIPVLVGTKYDQFATFPSNEQAEITKQVRPSPTCIIASSRLSWHELAHRLSSRAQAKRFSKAMHAPLIFCSTMHAINVQCVVSRSASVCAPADLPDSPLPSSTEKSSRSSVDAADR